MSATTVILACSTVIGPVLATLIAIYYTRYADARKVTRERRLEVFRNLMKTRAFVLHQDHVMSLNLVASDFSDDRPVIESLRRYMDHLYISPPPGQPESQRFASETNQLFADLMVAMGRSLGITLDSGELQYLRYFPTGWAATEMEQTQIRRALLQVLQGVPPISVRQAMPSQPGATGQNALFPPPPPNPDATRTS